jgi:hypothetical protein
VSPAARKKPATTTNARETKGAQILDAVAVRALGDTNYRRRLLDDPKAVLSKEGLQIGEDVEVIVHRNRPGVINLVLPAEAPRRGRKLSVDEIDLIDIHVMFGF